MDRRITKSNLKLCIVLFIYINKEVSHVSHLSYVSHKINDLHWLQVNASDSNACLNKLLFAKFSIMILKTINS